MHQLQLWLMQQKKSQEHQPLLLFLFALFLNLLSQSAKIVRPKYIKKCATLSKGKSKGYCKASISLWNKTNAQIKKLDSQAVDAMSEGDFDKAQAIAKEAKELKKLLDENMHRVKTVEEAKELKGIIELPLNKIIA